MKQKQRRLKKVGITRLPLVCGVGLSMVQLGMAANIAPLGNAILGVNDAIDADNGTTRVHSGALSNINDLDPGTRVDNWFGDAGTDLGQSNSFVGILWADSRPEEIQSLTLTMATFGDGGWFGTSGIGPANGTALTSEHLVEPTVQISTDSGATWQTVAHTSDYSTVMNGHVIGGPGSAPVTFTLNTPATDVDGIRIIGENGGVADGNGFIGVFELEVNADSSDSDSDGMPDAWETAHGLSVGTDDGALDADSDGLVNLDEYNRGTSPDNSDTDEDGLPDGEELGWFTSPTIPDTDEDGLEDGAEVNEHMSNPLEFDTDLDGLSDGDEVNTHGSDPNLTDTDSDGFNDGAEVREGSDPASASSFPDNFALNGTAILGTRETVDSGLETPVANAGPVSNVNDGNPDSRSDTYNGAGTDSASFVGVTWGSPVTTPITRLELTMATFLDGGWFGPNNATPGAGGALAAEHLTAPRVEISTDGGFTWTPVDATTDYVEAFTGHAIGNPPVNPTTATAEFILEEPVTDITGIRLIGTEGGVASLGFIGVFEFGVYPTSTDSDSDGMDDAWERRNGLDDSVNDAALDLDSDGLTNSQEFVANTDPQLADSDGDGLNDGPEVNTHSSNPLRADTDNDGLPDGVEVNTHETSPTLADTDSDGYVDGIEIAEGSDPKSNTSIPNNLSPLGTGILGTKETVESTVDTPWANAGAVAAITDANITTRVDTYNGGSLDTVSYVGVLWDEPRTITELELSLAIFFDGGWFGVNNLGPGSGGTLAAEHLVEPTVQVTTDDGATWTTVPHTSNYIEQLTGHPLPAVDFGAPTTATATFELTTPQEDVDGVRILATEGGTASGGFLGVWDLAVRGEAGPPVEGITLGSISKTGDQFAFAFDSEAGATHVVQYKNAVTDATWQTLTTVTGDGTRKTVTDTLAQTVRIYRVSTE